MTFFCKNKSFFFFLKGFKGFKSKFNDKRTLLLDKKNGERHVKRNKFTNFEIRRQISSEGSEAVKRK